LGAVGRINGGTTFGIIRIVNHPSYDSNTLANDISLIQTSNNVGFTGTIAPAVLGSDFIGGGVSVIASGWGQTSHPGSAPTNLQWIALNTLTNADCRSRFSTANAARVFDNTICTFTREGEGTCMGDSGGPLAQGNTVIGAVSWGIPCGTGSPDVYVRISSHRTWISSISG
jgi:trypsin